MRVVLAVSLKSGNSKGCGCKQKRMIKYQGQEKCLKDWAKHFGLDRTTIANRIRNGWSLDRVFNTKPNANQHKMRDKREYGIWKGMKQRCNNPKHQDYYLYGAKGIWVCKEWNESFTSFYEDMGDSNGLSIDRIDFLGGYTCGHCLECRDNNWPSNCRWATLVEQARNKTTNRLITFNGKTKSLAQWADDLGINRWVIHDRISMGWSIEEALTIPLLSSYPHALKQYKQKQDDANKEVLNKCDTC